MGGVKELDGAKIQIKDIGKGIVGMSAEWGEGESRVLHAISFLGKSESDIAAGLAALAQWRRNAGGING